MKVSYEIWRYVAPAYLLVGAGLSMEGIGWALALGWVGALLAGWLWWKKVSLVLPKWMARP